MNTEQVLFIRSDGLILSVGDPPQLEVMGEAALTTRKRASSILPVNPVKRICFRLLRLLFGERGKVAGWTRRWYGPWTAKLFATGETFTAQSRRVVLSWEHRRLEEILCQ